MSPAESEQILRFAVSCWPTLKLDDQTPAIWAKSLEPITLELAKAAILELATEREFIHISVIVQRSKSLYARISERFYLEPPAELADDPAAYIAWLKTERARLVNEQLAALREPVGVGSSKAIEG